MNDNRMLWIRNIEKLNNVDLPNTWDFEYEIASECRIAGILNYGNGKILCRLGTVNKTTQGLYHYFLRVRYAETGEYNKEADSKGYYCKDGVLGELLSLFSLYFRCRFYLVATYQEPSEAGLKLKIPNEFLYKQYDHGMHLKALQNSGNFSLGLADFLDSVKLLDNKTHQQFILACYDYANALKEIGIDGEMVFIRLVSAIETLSKHFELRKKDNPLNGVELDSMCSKNKLSDSQITQLRQLLHVDKRNLIRPIMIGKKYLKFIEKHSKHFLKGGNWKAKHCKITRKDFSKYLKAIYNARSAYLHSGEPMYLSQSVGISYKWDTDPSCGMIVDNRSISRKKKLPYAYWFEDLVRYCLLDFLRTNQTSSYTKE